MLKKIALIIIGAIVGISIATKQPIMDTTRDVFKTIHKTYNTMVDSYSDVKAKDNASKKSKTDKIKYGKVIKVYDADTITIKDSNNETYKIRFYGIDAPELKQSFGKTAQMNLEKLIKNEDVEVEIVEKDRYGRLVGKIYMEDGLLVNKWLVANGFAFVYEEYNNEKDEYLKLQNEAKTKKLGLWKLGTVEKPSEWRKKNSK